MLETYLYSIGFGVFLAILSVVFRPTLIQSRRDVWYALVLMVIPILGTLVFLVIFLDSGVSRIAKG